ncbi:MAG: rhodanese-like domain-containing protein [Thermodesulfobacteriota bacterium]|nr:rhodanese-like domain-containing protein [Thermodesulfobacteriota bacterium]
MRFENNAFWREGVRITIILAISLGLALVVNVKHPMGLPLHLNKVKRPGIPGWVWAKLHHTHPRSALEQVAKGRGTLVDVRDAKEYRNDHAQKALNLPYHDFNNTYPHFSQTVPVGEPLFIYCYGTACGLSPRVAKRLLALGYTNLTIVKRGYEAWKKSGLPIEDGIKG